MIHIPIFLFIIVLLLIGLFIYLVINTLKKSAKLSFFINRMYEKINHIYKTLKDLDQKEMFEKDDEVGILWEQIKSTIESFNEVFEKEE